MFSKSDQAEVTEFLGWVAETYGEEVATVCRDLVQDQQDGAEIIPGELAWKAVCQAHEEYFARANRLGNLRFNSDLRIHSDR